MIKEQKIDKNLVLNFEDKIITQYKYYTYNDINCILIPFYNGYTQLLSWAFKLVHSNKNNYKIYKISSIIEIELDYTLMSITMSTLGRTILLNKNTEVDFLKNCGFPARKELLQYFEKTHRDLILKDDNFKLKLLAIYISEV